jgi:hypothetical protein
MKNKHVLTAREDVPDEQMIHDLPWKINERLRQEDRYNGSTFN